MQHISELQKVMKQIEIFVCSFFFFQDLGFHGSVFNLVFATNKASIALWESLGFTKIGTVPKCARLTGCADLIDANIYYYDLSSYSPQKHANLLRCSGWFERERN